MGGKDRNSAECDKRERAQILWDTIERIIPDVKQRVEVEIYASPLTHQRFLRRHRGTYGPALNAGGRLFGTRWRRSRRCRNPACCPRSRSSCGAATA